MIRRIALARVLFGVVVGGVVLAGCTTLPESGAVHRVTEASPDQDQGPAYVVEQLRNRFADSLGKWPPA